MKRQLTVIVVGFFLLLNSATPDTQVLQQTGITVEAVLRALQARQLVLEQRKTFYNGDKTKFEPIVWGDGIDAFPVEHSVTDLHQAIKMLNVASVAFDAIKREFLAYDTTNDRFINLRHTEDPAFVGDASGQYLPGLQAEGDNPDWIAPGGESQNVHHSNFLLASIDLPSVGAFDEANWRRKIILLASNIDHLKALKWPLMSSTYYSGSYQWDKPASDPDDVQAASYGTQWIVDYPYATGPATGTSTFNPGAIVEFGSEAPLLVTWDALWWSVDGYAWVDSGRNPRQGRWWSGGIGAGTRAETGVAGKPQGVRALQLDGVPSLPSMAGTLKLFKGASLNQWGDLTEAVSTQAEASQAPVGDGDTQKTLSLGTLTQIDFPQSFDGYKTGNFNSSSNIVNESDDSALSNAFDWLQIAHPHFSGKMVPAPNPAADILEESFGDEDYPIPYLVSIDQGPVHRLGHFGYGLDPNGPRYAGTTVYGFRVGVTCVHVPQFQNIADDAANYGCAEYGLGTVEPVLINSNTDGYLLDELGNSSMGIADWNFFKIQVGRGEKDLNQTGWLGTRPDGFGSLTFHGSPDEFEVLYDTTTPQDGDQTLYGGPHFDSATEFTTDQVAATGWRSRWSYLVEWYSPRLRQVKGRDVLVNVTYTNPYKKKLEIYWAKDAGDFDGTLYAIKENAQPFRTIEIENPTVPTDGSSMLPVHANQLRITEDGERVHDFQYTITNPLGYPNRLDHVSYQVGDLSREITLEYLTDPYNLGPKTMTIADTQNNQTFTKKLTFDESGDSVWLQTLGPESWMGLTSIEYSSSNGGGNRKIAFQWKDIRIIDPAQTNQSPQYRYSTLGSATYSGTGWSEDGNEIDYDDDGFLQTVKTHVAGQTLATAYSLQGNTSTVTDKLGNDTSQTAFRTATITYSSDLKTVSTTLDGHVTKLTYNGPKAGVVPPWCLTQVLYPTGYQRDLTMNCGTDGTTFEMTEGWTNSHKNGTDSLIYVNPYGELISSTVNALDSGGGTSILLDQAQVTESTAWGAPTTISRLNGEQHATYYESGIHTGQRASFTDEFGTEAIVEFDKMDRISGFNPGFENFTVDPGNPEDIKLSSNLREDHCLLSSFGDVQGGSSDFGLKPVFNIAPGNGQFESIDGRSCNITTDAAGMVMSIANGQGSRGGEVSFSVSGGLCSTFKHYNQDGSVWVTEQTTYDALGRPVQRSSPSEDGSTAYETWNYDDEHLTVTYSPGAGPVAQAVKSVTAPDGGTTTISVGNNARWQYQRSVGADGVKLTTSIKDDSTKVASDWTEVSQETINPGAGTVSSRPWGNASNVATVTSTPGGNGSLHLVSQETGDDLTVDLANGAPTGIHGTAQGLGVTLSVATKAGLPTQVSGTIDAAGTGLTIGDDGRVSEMWWPGHHPSMTYDGQPAFHLEVQDSVQGTDRWMQADGLGDLQNMHGDGVRTINAQTVDLPGGQQQQSLNDNVQINTNWQGTLLGKGYGGGITESYLRNPDGSLQSFSITGPGGGGIVANVTQTPTERLTDYGGGFTFDEHFYNVGLRSSVTSPGDTRTFTYYHLQPQGETHTGGVWNGWSVEQVPDAQDRVGTIRISLGGAVVREFGLQYDGAARLQQSSSPEVTGTYGYGGMGAVGSLDRQVAGGGLYHTAWSYDAGTGWLTELNHQGSEFHYTYPGRDARGRLTAWTGPGAQWSDGSYDGIDQVQGFTRAGLEPFSYGYDARGNRLTQAGATQSGINLLDQVTARQMTSQRIGVSGTVTAGSGTAVQIVDNDGALDDTPANVNGQTGEYLWTKDLGGLASGGQRLDLIVRATKAGAGTNGTDAVAERKVSVALAAASEAFIYDGAGRLTDDGFWHYTWDGASRLTHLECKIASLIEPGAQSETLDFTYDADGRRLQKTRTVTYADGRLNKTETSQMLWVNWLPVMEIRAGFANHNGRRWFQWGADLSGTREGAGGIGGLVAIIEESTPGRVYLPMHDGLGNVTGLLDAGTGAVVARYDYGPYGEPLSASGDTEACPFRWQTKLYDAERQQYYFGYRHYDPRTGRWLSRDPLAEAGGLNLYAYCANDPVNRHDPLGLDWKDWPLINGGDQPVGEPFFDQSSQQWLVKMQHIVALTLGGRMNVTTDSIMGLEAAKSLAPGSPVWQHSLANRKTLLSGTGFQPVDYADVSNAIRQHPGWNAELGVMEGGAFAAGGGYLFGGIQALIGAQATGYLGSGLFGMSLGEWAKGGFQVTPKGAGQALGGFATGGLFAGTSELTGAFASEKFTLVGELMPNGQFAGMGPGAAFTGEFMPRQIFANMERKSPKIDYLFVDRNDAMNWARKQLGLGAKRVRSDSGKWIGWSNDSGNTIYWGHGDWGKGVGSSTFPHINYDIDGVGGHLFLETKIKNRGMWDAFTTYFDLTDD